MSNLAELVHKNRSYRRFDANTPIERQTLVELVDLARWSPSGRNVQPLKFLLVNDPQKNSEVFATLGWAGYLKDWPGPSENERPMAYILILGDKEITQNFGVDHGIAAQSILLGAVERGLGGCIVATVKREQLARSLAVPDRYEILLVVAIGKPVEQVVVDSVGADGDIKYWRDAAQVHHVPKRTLDELIIG